MSVQFEVPAARARVRPALPVRRWAERRTVVLSAAVLVFAAVFALRQSAGDAEQAIDLLYVVPVALVALELGLIAGLAAAVVALALVGVWVGVSDGDVGAAGIVTRGLAFFAVGGVAGRFSDHLRDAALRQRRLLDSGLRLAHLSGADEIPATLATDAQHLLGARGARAVLAGRIAEVGDAVGAEPEQVPIEVHGVRFGTLSITPGRRSEEDHVMLATLALQAAIAEENRRLLGRERERAAMRAELHDARAGLERRGRQLEELIARQEQERSHLAHELHEGAAQMLAALLLGLGALERELGSELAAPRLGELRSDADSTLRSLRSLAVSLRPPALMLGLRAALEGLARERACEGCDTLAVAVEGVERLGAEVETIAYRVVEEAVSAIGGACAITVRAHAGGLEIVIDAGPRGIDSERLTVLSARLELAGGAMSLSEGQLRALIPLQDDVRRA
jgi:signal transduction histidine kinase